MFDSYLLATSLWKHDVGISQLHVFFPFLYTSSSAPLQ